MNNQDIINYVMDTPHNTNPTILKQKLNEQDFENRSDWNQNDSTKPDYVKNRTHYTELVDKVYEVTIVDTTAITPISDEVAQAFNSNYENITFTLNDGTVLWLKKDYKLNVNSVDGYSWIAGSLNTIRFGFGIANESHYLFASKPGVFKGIAQEEVVHKIPEKYLPDGIGGGSGDSRVHIGLGYYHADDHYELLRYDTTAKTWVPLSANVLYQMLEPQGYMPQITLARFTVFDDDDGMRYFENLVICDAAIVELAQIYDEYIEIRVRGFCSNWRGASSTVHRLGFGIFAPVGVEGEDEFDYIDHSVLNGVEWEEL